MHKSEPLNERPAGVSVFIFNSEPKPVFISFQQRSGSEQARYTAADSQNAWKSSLGSERP